jgi:protein-S-isoprenylcysteine O-methyltransferase Ste14
MTPPETRSKLTRDGINRFIQVFFVTLFIGLCIFLPAWRIDWIPGWIFIGIYLFGIVVNALVLLRVNPDVINARGKVKEDTKRWDKVWGAFSTPATLAVYVVSGFDGGRFSWSSVPGWAVGLGFVLFAVSWLFTIWSMAVNPHFETTVRIQEETGHQTVSSGPYAIVRHPGYVAFILMYFATPLILHSLWGLVPAGVVFILFILRTAREDRTLHEELPGYSEYTQKVRYRLFPGIW